MVALGVVGPDHGGVGRGQDRLAEPGEVAYFADKEELFFAEDEQLLGVIGATLEEAPAGEPVLELARRATRALACFQTGYQRWVRDPARTCPAWSTTASPPWPA